LKLWLNSSLKNRAKTKPRHPQKACPGFVVFFRAKGSRRFFNEEFSRQDYSFNNVKLWAGPPNLQMSQLVLVNERLISSFSRVIFAKKAV
jgi:hypothetical protein